MLAAVQPGLQLLHVIDECPLVPDGGERVDVYLPVQGVDHALLFVGFAFSADTADEEDEDDEQDDGDDRHHNEEVVLDELREADLHVFGGVVSQRGVDGRIGHKIGDL